MSNKLQKKILMKTKIITVCCMVALFFISSCQSVHDDSLYMDNGMMQNPMMPDFNSLEDESYKEFEENKFLSPYEFPLSTFSIDVDVASYSNIRQIGRASCRERV